MEHISSTLVYPILIVSHRNRAGQKEGGLHAAKGTGDIEYKAETVIDLTAKSEQPNAKGITQVNMAIHKNRHGTLVKEIPLQFCGRLQEFHDPNQALIETL